MDAATMPAAPAAPAALPNSATQIDPAQPIDYKALLLQTLKLDPAADDAAIQTAADAAQVAPAGATADPSQSDLQTQLAAAQARIAELEKAELDELIAEAGELPDDAKAALRNTLSTDRAGGMAILGAMKKNPAPAAPAAVADAAAPPNDAKKTAEAAPGAEKKAAGAAPPKPVHDPKAAAKKTDQQKVTEANALIAKIRKEGKFKDYNSAREEARRQQPDLFS